MVRQVSVRLRACTVLLSTIALPIFAACKGGIPGSPGDLSTSQTVLDIGNMVVQLREENAQLQAQIDSLRSVTAYQDTIVRQLAGAAGLTMRAPSAVVP